MTQALLPPLLVLAGGFGSRLQSVVADVPKPMAPVGRYPFLHHLTENWVAQGVTRFVFLLHHKASIIEAYLDSVTRDGHLRGCDVGRVTEPHPLGTGGSVAHAVTEFDLHGPLLVANGDTWLGNGIAEVAGVSAPAMAVVDVPDTRRYGRVRTEAGRIVAFEEKAASSGAGWINAGLYHLDASAFRPWSGEAFSIESTIFPELVRRGELRAAPVIGDFTDIGVPDDYARFARWAESGKQGPI
jgi:D-glycero-alpha-D-manno-heptose 1-phosphate guanylyltransferase